MLLKPFISKIKAAVALNDLSEVADKCMDSAKESVSLARMATGTEHFSSESNTKFVQAGWLEIQKC